MSDHKLLENEDDRMQARYMDRFFALEDKIAKVCSVISLCQEFQDEMIPEVKVDPAEEEARLAALAAKQAASKN